MIEVVTSETLVGSLKYQYHGAGQLANTINNTGQEIFTLDP
jgi:hypothetical protein